jgi:serine/threonine-protein kinase RsbT
MQRNRSSKPPPALVTAFERFVSPINARALARSVAHRAGSGASPASLLQHIEATSVFFVPVDRRSALVEAAKEVLGINVPPSPIVPSTRAPLESSSSSTSSGDLVGPAVAIRNEADLNEARLVARQMCRQAGIEGFAAQKFVTAVSELVRNVAKYACPGRVMFSDDSRARKLRAVVSDRGKGIPHLEQVLDGKYRSKTGMGLGLVGTRKLVDDFDVKTGPDGTTITIAVSY